MAQHGLRFILICLALMGVLVLGGAARSEAASSEYPSLYKSPKIMGMGGASVAIGGSFASVFSNPAGIGTLPDGNWEVNILGVHGAVGDNSMDFQEDLQDAFDMGDADGDGDEEDDQIQAVNDVLETYRGENMHISLMDLTSIALRNGPIAGGVGGFGGATVNAIAHQGLGSEGLLEVDAAVDAGVLGAMSYKVMDRLYLGASAKVVDRESVDHFFSARELVENEDNLEDYIMDEVRGSGTAFGVDMGAIYEFYQQSPVRPSVGLSVLNIGDLDFDEAGKVPMTVNIGAAVKPDIPYLSGLTIGLDYVDLFNDYEEDSDLGKRVRLGGSLMIYENTWSDLSVSAGLYQGYPTFGLDLRLAIARLTYATYAEEVGAYSGQDKDRRQVLMLTMGW